jgi:hypothetical protein
MPRNPTTGVYTAPDNSWNPAVAGTVIDPDDWNATQADYVDALNNAVLFSDPQPLTEEQQEQARENISAQRATDIDPRNFGAKGDGIRVAVTASITSGTDDLVATGASFTSADVGKYIGIPGAGAVGVMLHTTIAAYVSPTAVTLADNASTTLSSSAVTIIYGTDDSDALNAALEAAEGRSLILPAGIYITSEPLYIKAGTKFFGEGRYVSTIYSGVLTFADHMSIRAEDVDGWSISGIGIDNADLTSYGGASRCVRVFNCKNWVIEDCYGRTAGAFYGAFGNSSRYIVKENIVEIASYDGANYHDGILDQWDGANDFCVLNNTVYGNGIGAYGIIATGTSSTPTPNACFNFRIEGNSVFDVDDVGIFVNGRDGENHSFFVVGNLVDTVTNFHGIGIADSYNGVITDNIVLNCGLNGIRLTSETGEGGTLGVEDCIISENFVSGANQNASGSAQEGAAIALSSVSNGNLVANNRVVGNTQTYSLLFGGGTSNNREMLNYFDAGVTGTVSQGASSNLLSNSLLALAAYNTNGLLTQTTTDTFTGRTITGTASEIIVTNGDGVSGNPTLSLDAGVYRAGGTDVAVADGGTGAGTARAAAANLSVPYTVRNFVAATRVSQNDSGDTTEQVLATYSLPANALGPNGMVKVTAYWNVTGGTSSKSTRTRWGGLSGTTARAATLSTNYTARELAIIANRNATNSQFISNAAAGIGGWQPSTSVTYASVDTTQAVDIVFSAWWAGATSGETIILEGYEIEIFYGA